MDFRQLTIHESKELLEKKEINSLELTQSSLDRIEEVEEKIKAFVTVTKEEALARAKIVDEKISAGEKLGPLAGIPMAVKDNICTEGIKTTCSSKMLANFVPPYNATVIDKLLGQNSILLGKSNMDEFAMGCSTENSAFFATKNPWDLNCVPGGSSGGSAAAVAAGEVLFALGTDTGGSIRQPAAFCGVVGLKPTYGLVSRYGLIAYGSSLDQIGPITKDVTDCALVMNVLAGYDPQDSTSVNMDYPDYSQSLVNDIKGMRIGLPKEYLGEGIDAKVEGKVKEVVKKLEELGAIVEECSLPHTDYAIPTYIIIATAEGSSNLARYDGVRYGYRTDRAEDVLSMYCRTRAEGFGEEVKQRILFGTYVLSSGNYETYYLKALKLRTLIKQDFDQAFERYDCLLTPTAPNVAFEFGTKADPTAISKQQACTIPVNLAGIPALNIPFGQVNNKPVGIQLIGKAFDEGTLLRVAYTLEQNSTETRIKPEI